jgi:L,D-peptidoglycan transpeptidase YkuD (ErfK/YbiS/YcfS/YnhG family)
MRRPPSVFSATACVVLLALASAPFATAADTPWFANEVGDATQVVSVVGTTGSHAKMDVWQRSTDGWNPVGIGIPANIGSKGMAIDHTDGSNMTPMGIFSLDFAFGTQPNPGGGLQYVQVDQDHWWDGDMKSPTYNTMQVCKKAQCAFNTDPSSGTENLDIPEYAHAVVMGVNKERVPGKGGAFFVHTTDGGATAGCVAISDATLVTIMKWLQPGAVIAVAK